MCGIAGIVSTHPNVISMPVLKRMADAIAHRGPDGEGFWMNDDESVGFGHRRLAIIDLSENGAQPMHYRNRYSIVYNGEIYNYRELKNELQKAGYTFSSSSDTEVILAAYAAYKERCLQFLDGMFSFAIWDAEEKTLFMARDRFGEKPFYYFADKQVFAFGSEMKALWAAGVERSVENKMLLNYLSLGYVQNPSDKSQTFYRNIYSLPSAHYAVLKLEGMQLKISQYWDIDKQATQKISIEKAQEKLEELLTASVKRRLRSDVPIGSSLSGGIDSSTIAYLVTKQKQGSIQNFETFSAVFPGFKRDESSSIDKVVEQFGFTNHSTTPTADGLLADFEKLCHHQEEPFPSSSIYAQYKVFELAKQHNIKVLLDGQGADEILAGYNKYIHWFLQEQLSRYRFVSVKKERDLLVHNKVPFQWGLKNLVATFFPAHVAIALEKREHKLITTNPDVSPGILSLLKGREWDGIHKPIVTKLNDILYFNTMHHGLEELLRYADRNSMAHGTEVRLPFLNAELVQFIFSLPSSLKINDGFTKWILRKTMAGKLPEKIVWRTDKIGFEPPQKLWMQDENLKEYMHEAKRKLVNEKILKQSVLNKKIQPLDAHAAHNSDWRYLCAAQIIYK